LVEDERSSREGLSGYGSPGCVQSLVAETQLKEAIVGATTNINVYVHLWGYAVHRAKLV
jgi:hypothetical protein